MIPLQHLHVHVHVHTCVRNNFHYLQLCIHVRTHIIVMIRCIVCTNQYDEVIIIIILFFTHTNKVRMSAGGTTASVVTPQAPTTASCSQESAE